jgi:hypothetical protein
MAFLEWISGSNDPVPWPIKVIFTIVAVVLLVFAGKGRR